MYPRPATRGECEGLGLVEEHELGPSRKETTMKDELVTMAEQVIRDLKAVASRNDLDGLVALFAEDATIESYLVARIFNRKEGVCRGRAEIRELGRALLKRGVPWGGHEPPIVRGNTVAIEYRTASSDTEKFSVDIIEVRDDKIQSLRAYAGWRAVMAATQRGDAPQTLDGDGLDLLFLKARTHYGWLDRPVDDALLRRLYELARMAPTSGNNQPMRIVFVKNPEAKERLLPALIPANVGKTKAAPVTAIVAYDTAFYELMPKLFPARPEMREAFAKMPDAVRDRLGFQGGTLQGAYLLLAARSLGLDCGPMGGFDAAKVDAAFFPDGRWKSNFLINLGYGDPAKLQPRNPRLDFDEACRIE
jgi:3-hydroxypropanoate dehydrogenase